MLRLARPSASVLRTVAVAPAAAKTGTRLMSTAIAAPSRSRLLVGAGAAAGVFGLGLLGAMASDTPVTGDGPVFTALMRSRLKETFGAFAFSITATAAGATIVASSPSMLTRMMNMSPLMSLGVFLVGGIGSMMLVRSIPYRENRLLKFGAFAGFSGIMGASLAPLTMLGGPLLMRAAVTTAAAVGSLSLVAATSPSEQWLWMGGPLAMGLGIVCIASLGSAFLPAAGAASGIAHSISLYGGTALFSGFVLYDTSRIIHAAETVPEGQYDPVNMSISIYLDTINLFTRIVMMMAGGGSRRR